MKKHWKKLAIALLTPFMALNVLALLNPGNRCATSPQHADERLRTRIYAASPHAVSEIAQKLIPQLKTYRGVWRIREVKRENETTIVWCEVPVLFFTDDLHIRIEPRGNVSPHKSSTQLNVISQSRVGRSDLGENRRHVLQLLGILDKNLH
jgi:uncharacterized protein (DUF1499 family)